MLDHLFFPIDNSFYIKQYKDTLNLEFGIENDDETYPINIIDNKFFNIDTIITEIFSPNLTDNTSKKNTLILQAPDELIDFSTLDLSKLTSLSKLSSQLKNEIELKKKFGLDDFSQINFFTKFKMILPLFIRCPIEEMSKKEFINPVSLIMHEFPDHLLTTILRLLIYARTILISKNPLEIKFNLENALVKINSLILNLCEKEIQNKDDGLLINIFPFLLPKVTEIVCAASMFSFDASTGTEPTKYHLYNLLGQFFIIIASNYPPSFENTGWQTFSKYFSRIGDDELIESKTYPDYSFILKYPNLVEPNIVACCVTDLLNSFNLLSYLGLNLPQNKKAQVYAVLIKLLHWNQSFGRSAARSLINLYRYPIFKNAMNEFKQDLESPELSNLVITLYELMIAYNFTEDIVRFELKNKLSSTILEQTQNGVSLSKKKLLNGFQKLFVNDTTKISSIFEAAQIVNGIAIQYCTDDNHNLADLALIMHENQFLHCLEEFLNNYIKDRTFLDLKFAQPFIVLASRYVQIRSKIVSLTDTKYLGISIELILNLYSSILLSGPALNTKKQQFTTLSADLYVGRSIIAQSIQKNCPRFIVLASEYLKSKRMSLLEPYLFLLSDYFTFTSFDTELLKDLNDNLVDFFNISLTTESTILSKALIKIVTKLCEKSPLELLNDLIASIIKQLQTQMDNYLSVKEAPRNSTKIIYIISQISSTPHGKIFINSNSEISNLFGRLNEILKDKTIATDNKYLTIFSLQLITNLICPAITLNKDLDFILRCGSELPPSHLLENCISGLCSLLNFDPDDSDIEDEIYINAIRALRYGCENPFIVKIFNDNIKHTQKFSLNINKLEKETNVIKNPDFYITLLELANVIAKFHSNFAFKLIGLSNDDKILCKSYLREEKVAGELYNLKKKGTKVKNFPKILFGAIQKNYNKNKKEYNDEKLKIYSNPLPPDSTTAYMSDLPKEFYEKYIECSYKKKRK